MGNGSESIAAESNRRLRELLNKAEKKDIDDLRQYINRGYKNGDKFLSCANELYGVLELIINNNTVWKHYESYFTLIRHFVYCRLAYIKCCLYLGEESYMSQVIEQSIEMLCQLLNPVTKRPSEYDFDVMDLSNDEASYINNAKLQLKEMTYFFEGWKDQLNCLQQLSLPFREYELFVENSGNQRELLVIRPMYD